MLLSSSTAITELSRSAEAAAALLLLLLLLPPLALGALCADPRKRMPRAPMNPRTTGIGATTGTADLPDPTIRTSSSSSAAALAAALLLLLPTPLPLPPARARERVAALPTSGEDCVLAIFARGSTGDTTSIAASLSSSTASADARRLRLPLAEGGACAAALDDDAPLSASPYSKSVAGCAGRYESPSRPIPTDADGVIDTNGGKQLCRYAAKSPTSGRKSAEKMRRGLAWRCVFFAAFENAFANDFDLNG